jgi:hypothetical protein
MLELQLTELAETVTVAVGTDTVKDVVAVPITVLPLYVVSVRVKVADFELPLFIAVLIPVGTERSADVLVLVALAEPNR